MILDAAQCVCAEAFNERIELKLADEIVGDDRGYRHSVRRYDLVNPPSHAPSTVIVKQSNRGGGHIFNEWAALALLNRIDAISGLAPRLYGGNRELELLVLEDLGAHPKLRDELKGSDPTRAKEALVSLAGVLGRLQGATCGRFEEYNRIKSSLPSLAPIDFHQRGMLFDALAEFGSRAEVCGAAVEQGLEDDLSAVVHELRNPGMFSSLVHGDCCPSNATITDRGSRLYDFEVAGFGHALLDGAYARLRHLNCLDAYRIPREIQQSMEAAYRGALVTGCPAANDDTAFARGMTAACAAWMAVTLRNLPRVLEEDKPRGPASFRQRILASLDAFSGTAADFRQLDALRATACKMLTHLRGKWAGQTVEMKLFPAFE
ncbi:MAG: phosphotransferase [Phycisphaerales bacterium]